MITVLIQRWEIELEDGWTPQQVWSLLNQSEYYITIVPPHEIPLVLRRRGK
jgi:hypothetical protein